MTMMKKLTQTAAAFALIASLPATVMAEDLAAKTARLEMEAELYRLAMAKTIIAVIEAVETENGYAPLSRNTVASSQTFSPEEEYLALTEKMPMPEGVQRDEGIAFVPEHECPRDAGDPAATKQVHAMNDIERMTHRFHRVLRDRNVLRSGDCSCAGRYIPWSMAEQLYAKLVPQGTDAETLDGIEWGTIDLGTGFYQTMLQFCGER